MGLHLLSHARSDGKRVIDQIVGTGTVDEFLELLEDIRDSLKRGEYKVVVFFGQIYYYGCFYSQPWTRICNLKI